MNGKCSSCRSLAQEISFATIGEFPDHLISSEIALAPPDLRKSAYALFQPVLIFSLTIPSAIDMANFSVGASLTSRSSGVARPAL